MIRTNEDTRIVSEEFASDIVDGDDINHELVSLNQSICIFC